MWLPMIAGAAGDQNAHTLNPASAVSGRTAERESKGLERMQQSKGRACGKSASQGRLSGRRARHPLPPRHQGDAEGDADHRRPAGAAIRGRRGARGRHRAFRLRHRPQQGGHRGPFRHRLRAGGDARASAARPRRSRSCGATCRRPARSASPASRRRSASATPSGARATSSAASRSPCSCRTC